MEKIGLAIRLIKLIDVFIKVNSSDFNINDKNIGISCFPGLGTIEMLLYSRQR